MSKTRDFANVASGLTSTAEELNYLNVTTPGESEASKALTTNASGNTVITGGLEVTGTFAADDLDIISQAEAEGGTDTNGRLVSGQRLGQAIAALATSVVPNKLISGLNTAYGADTQHDVVIQPGICTGQDDATVIELTSAITKQIDATWASGTNAGGLASGASLAANTWYHMFAVIAGGSADAMFDTSVTCANGVANNSVTFYRRIGSVKTDGSANILWYHQTGNHFLTSPVELFAGAIGGYTTLNTPLGVKTMPLGNVTVRGYNHIYLEDADPDFGAKNWKAHTIGGTQDLYAIVLPFTAYTDSISRIYTRASASPNYGYITNFGWVDPRGEY